MSWLIPIALFAGAEIVIVAWMHQAARQPEPIPPVWINDGRPRRRLVPCGIPDCMFCEEEARSR